MPTFDLVTVSPAGGPVGAKDFFPVTAVRRGAVSRARAQTEMGSRDSETEKLSVLQISEDPSGGSLEATDGHRHDPFCGLASNLVPKGGRS